MFVYVCVCVRILMYNRVWHRASVYDCVRMRMCVFVLCAWVCVFVSGCVSLCMVVHFCVCLCMFMYDCVCLCMFMCARLCVCMIVYVCVV